MSENESRSEGKVTDLMEALSVSLERAKADRRAPAPRADEGAERSKPHLLHGVFDSDGLTRFRLECPYEVKGVLPAGRRCWSLDDDGEIDSLQCFAKGWVDERGAELISFEITDPSFPIEVDVELHGLLQTPNLTLHVRSASSGDGGAPTDPYDTLHMLDVFLALGGTDEEFAEWIDGRAFADAWPQLVAAVAGRIDSLRADSNPPAGVLLKIAERRPAPSPVPEAPQCPKCAGEGEQVFSGDSDLGWACMACDHHFAAPVSEEGPPPWPEWLTPEYSAIHAAIENEMKRALDSCYKSADAAGMGWTTEGWISMSASNVISLLRRNGSNPPDVGEVEALPLPEDRSYDESEFIACPACGAEELVEQFEPLDIPGDGPLCWLPEGRWVRAEEGTWAKGLWLIPGATPEQGKGPANV